MDEQKHTALLPCPFCGSQMVAQGATAHKTISVWCMECGARGPDAPFPDFCDPVAQIELCHQRWNSRAVNTYPAVADLVGALEFYADTNNWTGGTILDMENSRFDGWSKAQSALTRFREAQAGGGA